MGCNDLSFFISHRLSIAEAALSKDFNVVIGYGALGGADPKALEQRGFRMNFIPMHSGGTSILKDFRTIFYIVIIKDLFC